MLTHNPKLIPILQATINRLEDPRSPYAWADATICNCGVFVQTALNLAKEELSDIFFGNWSRTAKFREENPGSWLPIRKPCTETGIDLETVYSTLFDLGVNIHDLEYLADPELLERAGIEASAQHYAKRDNLISYLKAWLDLIYEERNSQVKTEATEKVQVAQPVSV